MRKDGSRRSAGAATTTGTRKAAGSGSPVARSTPVDPPPAESATARPRLLSAATLTLLIALAALTLFAYAPVRHFDFVSIDDHVYVSNNPFIRSGFTWAQVPQVFVSTYANFWHPLTMLSLMLDVALFGAAAGPLHVTNLLFHVAGTLLLFLVLHRATRAAAPSAWVAALFALHPLHVESVAWISQRKDVLSTVFWMLTLLAYIGFARRPRWSRYGLALACFALGLMAKPMLVTLPFVLLLFDVWPLGRISLARDPARPGGWPALSRAWVPLIVEKLPFVALSAGASLVAVVAQQRGGAIASLGGFTLAGRLANAPIACVTYVAKTVWPGSLTVFYPYAQTPRLLGAAAATLLLIAVSTLVVRLAAARPHLAVGWFWYLVTLLPVSGLVQVGSHAMADRYTYVPLIGLFIAVAWTAIDLVPSHARAASATPDVAHGRSTLRSRLALATLAVGVVVACVPVTRAQVMTWKDSDALWQHALDVMPDNYYAHNAYGLVLQKQGQADEAAAHFAQASTLAPGFPNADTDLGLLLAERGRTADAIAHYLEALRRAPDYAPAHANLGNALAQTGHAEEAIAHYQEALRLGPDTAGLRSNLANALMAAGRRDDALAEYETAVRLDPASASTHYNFGNALRHIGRYDAAAQHYREALRLNPSYADAHENLGGVLAQVGRTDEAIIEIQVAARLAPDPAPALVDLGNVLLGSGRSADALPRFHAALLADPNSAEAHMGFGTALFRMGRMTEALNEHQIAVRLAPGLADAHYNLAVTLEQMGRLQEAATEYEETRRLEGDSSDLDMTLGNIYERLGREEDARRLRTAATQARIR